MGTENVGVVSFNQVVLVPEGVKSDDVTYQASLTIPKGWDAATALTVKRVDNRLELEPCTLTALTVHV